MYKRTCVIALMLMLAMTGVAMGKTMLVRVSARNYQELYDHVTFKGTSIDIAGAQPGRNYDLVLDDADLPVVQRAGLAYEVLTPDLEGWGKIVSGSFGAYHSYAQQLALLRGYVTTYPSICVLESIGPSYEGRYIYGLKITNNPHVEDPTKPEVLIYAQIHAREWATSEMALHMIDTLLRNYGSNSSFQDFINHHQLWMFPLFNVDGYSYDYPGQNMWRKNRQPFGGSTGTDMNRDGDGVCNGNPQAEWGALVAGSRSSHNPPDETFMGAKGLFAPELQALNNLFKQHTFITELSLHSYSELVLWSYGHGELTPDNAFVSRVGQGTAQQIAALGGGTYTPEQSSALYPTNGDVEDWFYGWARTIGGFPCFDLEFEVGNQFYQPTTDLDGMATQVFKGAWYFINRTDTVPLYMKPLVPRPIIARLDTSASGNYTVHWTPIKPNYNLPDKWELEELQGLTVGTEDVEGATDAWVLQGATVATAQHHGGAKSFFLGNTNNMDNWVVTKDPFPVTSANDSVTFWVYYTLETNYDVGTCEVSLEGKEWSQLDNRYTGSSGWVRKAYSLAPWQGKSVFIRLRAMSDDNTTSGGMYVDDIYPRPVFATHTTINSNITDTLYAFTSKPVGRYWYRVRGHNVAWAWGDKGPLEDVVVVTRDVGCHNLMAPSGTRDSGASVTPACTVYNYGSQSESYSVRMRIGNTYNLTAQVSSHAPGAHVYVTFPTWIALERGSNAVTCSTELSGDAQTSNDNKIGAVIVAVHDVAAAAIVAPTGTIGPGPVTPQAKVHNYGTAREGCAVTFLINSTSPYAATLSFPAGWPPGQDTLVSFSAWTAATGSFTAKCSTYLATDQVPANNVISSLFTVGAVDVGATTILAPTGGNDTSAVLIPSAKVKNFGGYPTTFKTLYRINSGTDAVVYDESLTVANLSAGAESAVVFVVWPKPHAVGSYTTRCSTYLAGDGDHSNDAKVGSFTVTAAAPETGWTRKADLPLGLKNKRVKDGGCLACSNPSDLSDGSDTSYIYALKGNNRCEFYRYSTASNAWAAQESIPIIGHSGKKKAVKKGAAVGATGDNIYAAKGNNCLEFWLYNPSYSSYPWTQKADVPTGAKNVKEGAGAAAVIANETTYVYFLKGSGTQEFYRYSPMPNLWEARCNAPLGASNKTWKNGSCLAYDGANTIYALKGSYNEFFSYGCSTNAWTSLASLPLIGAGGKKKKVKDGAGIAYHGGRVYALKGGNTNEFWTFAADSHKWVQYPSVPAGTGKNVKGGGALTASPTALYAFKGNNTLDFFKYGLSTYSLPLAGSSQGGVMTSSLDASHSVLRIAPNPFTNTTTINYSLPEAGNVSLKLYDVTGQVVQVLTTGYHPAGVSSLGLRASDLPRGIYMLKLESGGFTTTNKIIIE